MADTWVWYASGACLSVVAGPAALLWLVIPGPVGAALSVLATVSLVVLVSALFWRGLQTEDLEAGDFRVFVALAHEEDRVGRLAERIEREGRRPNRLDLKEAMEIHRDALSRKGAERLRQRASSEDGEDVTEEVVQERRDRWEARRRARNEQLEARRKRFKEMAEVQAE